MEKGSLIYLIEVAGSQLKSKWQRRSRRWSFCFNFLKIYSNITVILSLALVAHGRSSDHQTKCGTCKLLVESFKRGMKETENQHFGGGNTHWEEMKLGKFATSETRLVEILEFTCKKDNLGGAAKLLDLDRNAEYKCHSLVEEHEEKIENWYFHKQTSNPNFLRWLCIDELRLCCPNGTYGSDCKKCPGELATCSARGQCDGEGTRGGTGKCKCDKGYVGLLCRKCDANFFASVENDTSIECTECHKSCKGGCNAVGPKGCKECRSGWTHDDQAGCLDINECDQNPCSTENHEQCVNSVGSFECACQEGYRKENANCIVDIIEKQNDENNTTGEANSTQESSTEREPQQNEEL